jgi:Flagellar hook-length control protein FliK
LLTGLSAGLPADPVPGDPEDRAVQETDPDVGRDAEAAPDAKAWAVTAPPAASDRAAASLALFAKSLALQADAAADPGPDSDRVDQFAASAAALPGLLAQGQGLPQSSPSGPTQLPVPHVAAQISAALTQSADGSTELALSPEELGNVRLRLERDAKHPERMVVHITFERPETLDLFRRHAGELAEALRDAGYAGADIGFGQQEAGAGTPDRKHGAAAPDYGSALIEAQPPEPNAPRLMAGASLDLRL